MQTQERLRNNLQFERKCDECGHLPVCAILRAIGPLLAQKWEDDDRPFEPEELATICKQFLSGKAIQALQEGL